MSEKHAQLGTQDAPTTPVDGRSWRSLLASEELDRETHRSVRLDEVLDVRRDALRPTRVEHDVGQGCRLSHEAKPALIDSKSTPSSACHTMISAQGVRHGAFIPHRCGPNDLQVGGNLGSIAQRARQRRANLPLASGGVVDPWGRPQRWPMPDMPTVEAVQQGDPITGVIPLELSDPTLHYAERTEARDKPG